MKRGDIVLVRFPHPSRQRGKRRPAVVVQSDAYAGVVGTTMVAEIASNLTMADDPACLRIDTATEEGKATGLIRDSVVTCLVLVTVYSDTLEPLGVLSPVLLLQLNDCLKAALEIS